MFAMRVGRRRVRFRPRWGTAVVVAVGLALLVAACSTGPGAPGNAAAASAAVDAAPCGADRAAAGPGAPGGGSVRVRPGDTLWALARRHLPEHDPRRGVDMLMRLNGLESALLRPGTVLRLPPQSGP